jgi:hypothetical protein
MRKADDSVLLERIAGALERIAEALVVVPGVEDDGLVVEPVPELSEPAAAPVASCRRCRHSKSDHHPLQARACFVPGCGCKGWRE